MTEWARKGLWRKLLASCVLFPCPVALPHSDSSSLDKQPIRGQPRGRGCRFRASGVEFRPFGANKPGRFRAKFQILLRTIASRRREEILGVVYAVLFQSIAILHLSTCHLLPLLFLIAIRQLTGLAIS